jgi:6-phosphogluconolactonase
MSAAPEIEVVENPARACAAMLVGVAAAAGHVILSGGSTPRATYAEFVKTALEVGVPVRNMTLWFGDERCVPPDDERANYRMARESLLDPLGEAAPTAVFRIPGELGPDAAAEEYERELRDAGPPEFDLLLLGIGPDGHTASLFPDQASVSEHSRLVVGVPQAGLEPFVPRVTITLPCIALAKHVVFLVSGASKADAVAAAFGADAVSTPHIPSSMVAGAARRVTVLLDPPAAGRL